MNAELVKSRLPGADGLRAIACLLVVWHHTAQKLNPEGASPVVQALHFLGMRGEVGVSLGFMMTTETEVKMIGLGLAVAVIIDVTLVRLVLAPGLLSLLGDKAWWLPAWLKKSLGKEVKLEH